MIIQKSALVANVDRNTKIIFFFSYFWSYHYNQISVHDYLQQACHMSTPELHDQMDIIVYDQNAPMLSAIPHDSFLHVLLNKLGRAFPCVYLLAGELGVQG